MYNPSTIKTNFSGLLGFRNSRDPDLKNLTSALTTSASGLYFDDIHAQRVMRLHVGQDDVCLDHMQRDQGANHDRDRFAPVWIFQRTDDILLTQMPERLPIEMGELGDGGRPSCDDCIKTRLKPVWNKFSHGIMVDRPLWVDGNALARENLTRAAARTEQNLTIGKTNLAFLFRKADVIGALFAGIMLRRKTNGMQP